MYMSKPAPRYTSYPTAVDWHPLESTVYADRLGQADDPLSLYVHIPFCERMCLYCGCSVVLNRKKENEERYVDYLLKEIALVAKQLGSKRKVTQVHFGGGTPTKLSIDLFGRVMEGLTDAFAIDFSGEIAIEIDPRTVSADNGQKLRFLKEVGFNRVSFGVQDTNPEVQRAVRRNQSYEMTRQTHLLAKEVGFEKINHDLIYGLPLQTVETFKDTIEKIIELHPCRIALFSYAKVPWLKKHQNAIKEAELPSTEEKFQIYTHARDRLTKAGYVAIGMDHFALEGDELAQGYRNRTLIRNFQGYSLPLATEMIGLGASAIGFVGGGYFQNLKGLPQYYGALDKNLLPTERGIVLNEEDHLRKWVIHTLMCQFVIDKSHFYQKYGVDFDAYFQDVSIQELEEQKLVCNSKEKLTVTPLGELLVRNVAMVFDGYHNKREARTTFSQSI